MNRGILITAVSILFLAGLLMAGQAFAAEAAGGADSPAMLGGKALKGEQVKTLKGRVYAQWADNPDGEVLFGVLYFNTDDPATGDPSGRASSAMDVRPPDPLFVCCAWGFTGGTEKNNPYAGWYHPQTTVRLKVKDKALMDRIIKASQDLVAMEVSLDGRTITDFKLLSRD